ncbi:MAG: hypothetical protein IJ218_00390 [Alphaproteobacteria bacterium]|nr:hypothetical protein [Alphaproteobacteria bacterium]
MITQNDIKIDVASIEEINSIAMAVRKQVFVEELGIPENLDIDRNDGAAAHIIAYIQKGHHKFPVGTMRIRSFAGFSVFERMSVIRDFRKVNISEAIMQYGFNYVGQKGYCIVKAACKKELLAHWQRCGFYVDENSRKVNHNGMKLIPIRRDLPPHPRALTMNSDPALLMAEEGHWYDDIQNNPKSPNVQKPFKINNILIKIKEFKQKYFNC